jgi:hypothetical protein
MSKPSFENIDRWFFEYTEGNLSPAQVEQLESFISVHPELQGELDVWSDAHVSPDENDFSAASLIKATPFYANTRVLAIMIISLLIGSYMIYDTFGVDSLYSKSNNDLAIISSEDDDFFESKIFNSISNNRVKTTSEKVKGKNGILNIKEKREEETRRIIQEKSTFELKSNNSKPSWNTNSSSVNLSVNLSVNFSEDINESRSNHVTESSEKESRGNKDISSVGLNDVIAYINRSELEDYDLAEHESNTQIEVNQNSFKRKLEKVLRKIKRMADQPIALRNTKDQYFHAPMMTGYKANFGMVGSALGNRIQTTSRNQWTGHKNQQLMNTVSWDGYVYALRGGLGVDVSYNNYSNSSIDNYEASLTYSPKFSVNKNVSIEPAVRFKMGAINIDTQSPLIGSEIEMRRNTVLPLFQGATTPIGSQLWYRDVGAGLLVNTKWFYTGINVDNIGGHYSNFHSSDLSGEYSEEINLTSVIGTEYQSLSRDARVSGYVLHQKYGNLNELWAGANFQWKWIQIGAAANSNLGFGGSAGIKFEKFSLHYNMDNVYSRLNDEKLLSHQITMRILLKPSRYAIKFLNM